MRVHPSGTSAGVSPLGYFLRVFGLGLYTVLCMESGGSKLASAL